MNYPEGGRKNDKGIMDAARESRAKPSGGSESEVPMEEDARVETWEAKAAMEERRPI